MNKESAMKNRCIFMASFCLSILLFLVSCSPTEGASDTIHLTVTNPKGVDVSTLNISYGDYYTEAEFFDGHKFLSYPQFPYMLDVDDYTKSDVYRFAFKLTKGGRSREYSKIVDTSHGGDYAVTFELPGPASYSDWLGPTVLLGGATMALADELPALKTWYSGTIASERWYKVSVTALSSYYVHLDNANEGTGTYTSDCRAIVLDENGKNLMYFDSSFTNPTGLFPPGSTIYLQVFGYTAGTYAIGVSKADY